MKRRKHFSRSDLENLFEQSREGDDIKQELNTELIRTLWNSECKTAPVPGARKEIIGIDAKCADGRSKEKIY